MRRDSSFHASPSNHCSFPDKGLILAGLLCVSIGCFDFNDPKAGGQTRNDSKKSLLRLTGPAILDKGDYFAGSKVQADFRFLNESSTTIRLDPHVDLSCGCTRAALTKVVIQPGETTTLRLTAKAEEVKGAEQIVMATLRLLNPRDTAPIRVGIRFKLLLPWNVVPSELALKGRPHSRQNATVFVQHNSSETLQIESVSSSSPAEVSIQVLNDNRIGTRSNVTKLQITALIPGLDERRLDAVFIQTNDTRKPAQELKIWREATPDYRLVPPRPMFVFSGNHAKATQIIFIDSDSPFSLSGWKCDVSGIMANLPSNKTRNTRQKIETIATRKSFETGFHRVRGILTLELSDGVQRDLEIPMIVIKHSNAASQHNEPVKKN